MPLNGNTFTRLYSWVANAALGIKIRADMMDADSNDMAAGISAVSAAVAAIPETFSAPTGSTQIGTKRSDTGAVALTLYQWIDQLPFRNALSEFGTIQTAIDAANTAGGGTVVLPRKGTGAAIYNLGITGLILYANVRLVGEVGRYAGGTTRGVTLIYSGTGAAIYCQNALDSAVENIDLDCTGATGTSVRGLWWDGAWKSEFKHVTVRGVTPAKGYSILIDTNTGGGPWGAQHLYLEMIEASDGIIRFVGSGASDGVTTTVCNTIRGSQYQIVSSQLTFINSTAENWGATGNGYDFSGAGCTGVMIGCDIENANAGAVGISITAPAVVRELGTIWNGFAGTVRVSGKMDTLRSYGGAVEFISPLVAATPVTISQHGDSNVGTYLSEELYPDNVTGGSQGGHRRWRRNIGGANFIDHDWGEHGFLSKSITTTATSAATVWTIPVQANEGLRMSVHAHGVQTGDIAFSNYRECVVSNNAGTLAITQQAQQTSGNPGALSFNVSGTNVLVTWTPTNANSTTPKFNLEIRGPWTSYA